MFVGVSRENHVSLGIGLIKCDCVCQGHFQLPFVSLSVKTLRPRYESHPSSSVSHQRRHSRERQYRQWPPSSNQRSVCKGGDLSMNNLPLPSPGRLPPLSQGSEEAKIAMFECPITFSHPSWIGDIFSLRGRIWVAFPEKVDRSMSENIAVQSVPRRSSAWGCFTISLIEFRQQQATGCTAWCQQSGYVSIVHAPPQNLENTCLRERERERRGGGERGERERERRPQADERHTFNHSYSTHFLRHLSPWSPPVSGIYPDPDPRNLISPWSPLGQSPPSLFIPQVSLICL